MAPRRLTGMEEDSVAALPGSGVQKVAAERRHRVLVRAREQPVLAVAKESNSPRRVDEVQLEPGLRDVLQ